MKNSTNLTPRSLYAYLVMRTDLTSMGLGKSRAQAMHAGNQMTFKLLYEPLRDGKDIHPDVLEWHAQGDGFGTAIAVGDENEVTRKVLEDVVNTAKKLEMMADTVIDTSYPYVVDDEIFNRLNPDMHTQAPYRVGKQWRCFCNEPTGAWLLGEKKDLEVLLARFSLTPNST